MKKPNEVTLLIVDDEEDLRDSIAFDFQRMGFVVLTAPNGRDAFEIVRATPVDLVISDIRMPEGDGIELLKRIRQIDPEIPVVILLTGFAESSEQDVTRMGADKVLPKPFDRRELIDLVFGFTSAEQPDRQRRKPIP